MENNRWLQIWIHPRITMRKILDSNPFQTILALAIIGGILAGMMWHATFWLNIPHSETGHRPIMFLLSAIFGGIFGIVNLYVGGWLYRLTGGWLGGVGTFTDLKCAVGWGNYPMIIANIVGLIAYFFITHPAVFLTIAIIHFALVIWGIIILLNLVGEAHRFSTWKALGAVLIGALLIFVLLTLIGLLIPPLKPLFH